MNPQDIFKSSLFGQSSPMMTSSQTKSSPLFSGPSGAFSPKQSYASTLQSSTTPSQSTVPTSSVGANSSATAPVTPKAAYVNSQTGSTGSTAPSTSSVNAKYSFQSPGNPATPPGNIDQNSPQYQYQQAFNQYLQSLQPSDAESSAEKNLSALQLQARKDNDYALEKPGQTLGFASGEAARVARNNSYGINAASDALNSLTGARTARTNATKAQLDFEKGLYDDSLTSAKPDYTEVSPGASLFNNKTGKSVYTAPTTAGQNGGTGGGGGGSAIAEQVKANPALFSSLTPTLKGQVLQALSAEGYDTTSLTIPNVSADQREKLDNYDTLQREAEFAKQQLDAGLNTGLLAGPLGVGANAIGLNQQFAQYNSAISNLSSILLKARSGAAVTPQEYERIKGFIPTITDDEKTAQTKIDRFFTELNAAKANYITRVTQTPQQIAAGGSLSTKPSSVSGGDYETYLKAIGQ